VGLALARVEGATLTVEDVVVGNRKNTPLSILVGWLERHDSALLALDAPLGWPTTLGHALSSPYAAEVLEPPPDDLFHRRTDTEIHNQLGKWPLEVGADRIARTAHAALKLLAELRHDTGRSISLAWDSPVLAGTWCIEVYPAATLASRNIRNGPDCLQTFASTLQLPATSLLSISANARDAILCAIAGHDFLAGECIPPTDLSLAKKEGWIWARRPAP
jgi:hypothetical protein